MALLSKVKWGVTGFLAGVTVLAVLSVFMPDRITGAIEWVAGRGPAAEGGTSAESGPVSTGAEVTVVGVRISQLTHEPAVVLKERHGKRYLPIWIGLMEASSIGLAIEGIDTPRPLSHDLLYSVLNITGAKVESVAIDDIKDGTYYAKLILNIGGRRVPVDSRPSDAIAIALRARESIYVEEKILDAAGLEAEKDSSPHPSS